MFCSATGTSSPATELPAMQSQLEQGSTSYTARTRRRNTWMNPRPILYFPELRLEYMAVPCFVPLPSPNRGRRREVPNYDLQDTSKYTYQLTSAASTRTILPLKLCPKYIYCFHLLCPFLGLVWMLFIR